jgi:hypothetical protein
VLTRLRTTHTTSTAMAEQCPPDRRANLCRPSTRSSSCLATPSFTYELIPTEVQLRMSIVFSHKHAIVIGCVMGSGDQTHSPAPGCIGRVS